MINITNAAQKHRSQIVFDQVNVTIEHGECVAIVGRNGAGKSTFLYALAGFSRLAKGSITIDGKEVHQPNAWQGSFSFLPEKFQLYSQLSVEENVHYFAQIMGLGMEDVQTVLMHTSMWDDRQKRIGALSKGMLQRVGLSIALLGEPNWVVLDEPTSGLDLFGRREMLKLMGDITSPDRSLLFTTHHMDEVRELATHVLYFNDKTVEKIEVGEFLQQLEEDDLR
ncbi:ABC transporter ATP-binding protein [Lentibacillus cibarius]|uniref:ABC transporter ATP-binding protein n=1 Tax=Lentibacillus cibarius TaxID=2583219 RepID=A0A549YEU4_9BACI|nr:ABC transporter ATP-binding protein [Lentibacillus cibarius]TMN21510.1 ABC transporter ATP-binding protein [Lentibacillus cibarius]TRM10409.1 ABC transporter ATP-binding protein [Lentibacillus cibarius]